MKTMRFYLLIVSIMLVSASVMANDNTRQSLTGSLKLNTVDLMISGDAEYSTIGGANVGSGDIRVGAVLNNHFTTAIYYQRSVNDFISTNEFSPGLYTEYQSVGGILGLTIFPNRMVHATFPVKLGYGHLEMDSDSDWNYGWQDEQHLFVFQPGAFGVFNVTPAVSLYMGGTWRFTNDFEYRTITTANMNGFTAQVGLKLRIPAFSGL